MGKVVLLGEMQGSRKRERPNVRAIDSVRSNRHESTGTDRAVEDRTLEVSLIQSSQELKPTQTAQAYSTQLLEV